MLVKRMVAALSSWCTFAHLGDVVLLNLIVCTLKYQTNSYHKPSSRLMALRLVGDREKVKVYGELQK